MTETDLELQKLVKSAEGVGYANCLCDITKIVGELSKVHPKATIDLIEEINKLMRPQ